MEGPADVKVAPDGAAYVADYDGNRIYRIKDGTATVLAGSGIGGYKDGPGNDARFLLPIALAIAPDGHVLVADSENRYIRHIDEAGLVTTHAGSGAQSSVDGSALQASFTFPIGLAFLPDGRLLIVDVNRIRVLN